MNEPKPARPIRNPPPQARAGANATPPPNESPFKGKTGLTRLLNAAGYSWAGLRAAYRHESAFRQEVWLTVVLTPVAFYLGDDAVERALMLGSLLLVLIVELLNSAIETALDRVSLDFHPLIRRAKDIGSAAVLLTLVNAAVMWVMLII